MKQIDALNEELERRLKNQSEYISKLLGPLTDDSFTFSLYGKNPGGFVYPSMNGVKLTHIRTGIVVKCHKYKSVYRNKAVAVEMLKKELINYAEGGENEK